MDDTIDLLQIKIENAKKKLPEDTLNAISAVPWQASILKMRETRGYTFEQLGDLELETELLLCGLLSGEDYPKELEKRMKISQPAANELVLEMNSEVFSKIKEELIKSTERKKIFAKKQDDDAQVFGAHGIEIIPARNAYSIAVAGGTKPDLSLPELDSGTQNLTSPSSFAKATADESAPLSLSRRGDRGEVYPPRSDLSRSTPQEGNIMRPIHAQKLSGSVQIPTVKTEHTLENITKTNIPNPPSVKANKPVMDPYRELPE